MRRDTLCSNPKLCNDHPTEHAEYCDVYRLELAMAGPTGELLQRVFALRSMREEGLTLLPSFVTDEEFRAMRIYRTELERWQREHQPQQPGA